MDGNDNQMIPMGIGDMVILLVFGVYIFYALCGYEYELDMTLLIVISGKIVIWFLVFM